ncbi:hypothetical protein Ae201684_018731 [Aphanomyces euteiches]|uniref:Uncharacterized protein n=1 Tax=Aphanomyces euteiches TaxID=100861 RepID=A0A6G0W527_9STRA|nr:hypothetical protein Ae201684_018731 [Aphanomyces euteiches]
MFMLKIDLIRGAKEVELATNMVLSNRTSIRCLECLVVCGAVYKLPSNSVNFSKLKFVMKSLMEKSTVSDAHVSI